MIRLPSQFFFFFSLPFCHFFVGGVWRLNRFLSALHKIKREEVDEQMSGQVTDILVETTCRWVWKVTNQGSIGQD